MLIRHMLLWHNKRHHLVISHTQYSGGINSAMIKNHLLMTGWHVIQDSYLVLDIYQLNTVASKQKNDQTGFLCPYCSKKACRRRNAVSKWLKINSYPVSNNPMQLFNIQTGSTTTWQSKWFDLSVSNNTIKLFNFQTGSTTTWQSRIFV